MSRPILQKNCKMFFFQNLAAVLPVPCAWRDWSGLNISYQRMGWPRIDPGLLCVVPVSDLLGVIHVTRQSIRVSRGKGGGDRRPPHHHPPPGSLIVLSVTDWTLKENNKYGTTQAQHQSSIGVLPFGFVRLNCQTNTVSRCRRMNQQMRRLIQGGGGGRGWCSGYWSIPLIFGGLLFHIINCYI